MLVRGYYLFQRPGRKKMMALAENFGIPLKREDTKKEIADVHKTDK